MQTLTRRQWLIRAGGAIFVPALMSSCRPDISRRVSVVGKRLSAVYVPLKRNGCLDCDNCMPCPYGINIPSNLIFVDMALERAWLPGNLDDADFAEKGREFLSRYEASVPNRAQSQCCIDCGECLGTCPVDIDIPDQMSKITALTDILRDLRCRQL